MALLELRLEIGLAVAADAEPVEPVEDRVDRFLGRAGLVGVLDAQQIFAAMMAGEQPVEQRGAGAADVEIAGRRGGEAGDDARDFAAGAGQFFSLALERAFLLSDRADGLDERPYHRGRAAGTGASTLFARADFGRFRADRSLPRTASGRSCRCGSPSAFGAGHRGLAVAAGTGAMGGLHRPGAGHGGCGLDAWPSADRPRAAVRRAGHGGRLRADLVAERAGRGAAARTARGRHLRSARSNSVETRAAKGDLRLTLAPTDAGLAAAGSGFACRKRTRRRAWARAPSSGSGRGFSRRRRWRCPAATISPATPGSRASAGSAGRSARSRSSSRRQAAGSTRCATGSAGTSASQLPGSRGRHRHGARHRRPGRGQRGGCRGDAALRPRPSAVGQRAAHRCGGRRGDAAVARSCWRCRERLALRFNLVLVAAGVGALAGVAYTLLTGMQVPTVRACIAALLVLGGIALGRDAISLRLVAVGALVVLLFRPEALAGASFQMSFAAVTSIIALHHWAPVRRWLAPREEVWPMRLAARPVRAAADRPGGRDRADALRALPFPQGRTVRRRSPTWSPFR